VIAFDDVVAAEPVYVVATFDIGPYVFFFFRELALESSSYCDKTYFSRVSRVCKVCVWYCAVFSFIFYRLNFLNGIIALILRFFTEFDSFAGEVRHSG